ncbi:MAG: carboxypeptidase-like regulatory domain-containing protein [Bacteroidetes bacterium]|nr:carboxypeptidase-like regulatory domain-containing protein [Bacteroidota bacterium]MBS1739590.1 carboxypeptidase-like regulatory domain-containing protein [Bacteroidota bacterium]
MAMRVQFVVFFLLLGLVGKAANISGNIADAHTLQLLANVSIVNIHTNAATLSDLNGNFSIVAESGQLLEFRRMGYKTLRIRIPEGSLPPFFRVLMQDGPMELPEYQLQAKGHDWKRDSLQYHELYKTELDFPKLEGLDVIRHPFSAMSKANRQIWAFQKEYNYWEQQKYVDYTFSDRVVSNLTGLQGDSLQRYLKIYRPSYEQLRSMNEYTLYSYIKESVTIYRTGRRIYRPIIRRSAN